MGARGEGTTVGRWVRIDRRYNQPYRLTGYATCAFFKWTGLILAWAFVNSALAVSHLSGLILVTTAGLIWYGVHCARRNRRPPLGQPTPTFISAMPTGGQWQSGGQWRFNAPPNWPLPPPGWVPEPGWQPDPSWPPPPPSWQLWIPASAPGAPGERNSRIIPQDVKIAVSVRDQGKCVQCGSAEDLHFDHKVPWSRGGANTVNNIQLLCGPCNRRKGADDIPF
jgi:HNH endonuclease